MQKGERLIVLIGCVSTAAICLLSLFRIVSSNIPIVAKPGVQLWSVSFLHDGKTLVTAGGPSSPYLPRPRGELVLWNVETRREKVVLPQKSSVRSVASSPDGQHLAIGDFKGSTKLLNPATGMTIAALTTQSSVNAITFSPDSKLIASGSLDGTITIWNTITRKVEKLSLPNEAVINLAVSPDGHTLVATTKKGKAYLLSLPHLHKQQELEAYDGPPANEPNVEAVAFAPDGRSFATGCRKNLRLWEFPSGRMIRESTESSANINSLAFSPDGAALAIVDSAGMLTLWNPATGECRSKISAHSGTSFCVTFSPDGRWIATIGRDDYTTKIWDAKALTLLTALRRGTVSTTR